MLFNSIEFVALCLGALCCYFIVSKFKKAQALQVTVMLLASIVFYAWGQAILLPLLLGSSIGNAIVARILSKQESPKIELVILAVIGNLLCLGFFKYGGLLATSVTGQPHPEWLGLDWGNILLPIGISFFTFQGLSLVIDVYREKALRDHISAQSYGQNLLEVVTYIAFFPQLVAGPIVKARSFLPQFQVVRAREVHWALAVRYLIIGFFMKMVVADNLKDFTVYLSQDGFGKLKSGDLLISLFGYSCQIYADFAGYSLIALGLGALFGYRFPCNFNLPYLSQSFSEFWTRWHISLSSWLKEYLYFPLGGNRKGAWKTYRNLFIVMLLGGLWHGAGWNYLVWGGAHGLFLAGERGLIKLGVLSQAPTKLARLVRQGGVVISVTILWLFFILPDFNSFLGYWEKVFSSSLAFSPNIVFGVLIFSLPVLLQHIYGVFKPNDELSFGQDGLLKYRRVSRTELVFLGVLLALLILNYGTAGAFIYFQF